MVLITMTLLAKWLSQLKGMHQILGSNSNLSNFLFLNSMRHMNLNI